MKVAAVKTGYQWAVFDSNWLYRARSSGGYDALPLCVMWHHTAGADNAWGDAQYMCYYADAKPVANICVDSKIALVMAGGATNTNGSGDSKSFSRGTVAANDMNRRAVGIEICNNGVGAPYPAKQIDFLFELSNEINRRCGNKPEDVCTHTEYAPTRKVDPSRADAVQGSWKPRSINSSGSWSCADLKAECLRRYAADQEEDMPLSDEDIDKIAQRVWAYQIDTSAAEGIEPQMARRLLHRSFLILQQYLGGWNGKTPPAETMLERIDKNTR